jgi:CHAT domain-containing protein
MNISLNAQTSALVMPKVAFEEFKKGESFYLKGDYTAAIPFFEQATGLYENNYDGQLIASSLHSLSLLHIGQKNEAYNVLIQAAGLMNGDKAKTEDALIAYNLCVSRYYWESYELSKALELSQVIEKKIKGISPKFLSSIKIELYEYLGALKNSIGNYETAIQYYKSAIAAAEKLSSEERNKALFKFDYFKLGELYQKTKKEYEALALYRTIEKRKVEIYENNEADDIELLYQLGMIHSTIQEYDKSTELLKEVASRIKKTNKKGHRAANTNARLAEVMIHKKRYKTAINWNTQALKVWNNFLQVDDLDYIYEAYLNQGLLYQKEDFADNALDWYKMTVSGTEKDWKTALQKRGLTALKSNKKNLKSINANLSWLAYEKAADLIPRFPQKKQFPLKVEIHIAKGDLLFNSGNYKKAKTYYQEALDTMKVVYGKRNPWVSEIALKLSKCLLLEKDYAAALTIVNEAVNASLKEGVNLSDKNLPAASKIYYPFELLNAISTKGVILSGIAHNKTKKELISVLDNYAVAVQLLTRLRKIHRNEGERYKLSSLTDQICEQAVITANTLYELTKEATYLEEIFKYEELSKSANLLETIRDLKAKQIAKVPQELIDKEHQIKVVLSYLNKEIFYESKDTSKLSANRIKDLRAEVEVKRGAHQELLSKIEKEYPEYYKMKYDYQGLTIQELQNTLTGDEAVLEYMVSDSFVFVLMITKEGVYNQYKKTSTPISNQISKLLRYVRTNKANEFAKVGHKIYETIIGTVLAEKISGKKLIIVPDDALNYLPFGILPQTVISSEEQGSAIYGKLDYFIAANSIVYNYSAGLFVESKNRPQKSAQNKICAWAPSFENMGSVLKEKEIASTIIELPAAKEESDMIVKLFEGQLMAEGKGMEEHFKQYAADFGVLHIATHGIMEDNNPIFSNLVFNAGGEEDGILHTYELFNMQLNAELAVLSACNSGVGKLKKGEGVVSVARGFAYAGVPNIVMSTWAVSDEATRILMNYFYLNLQEGYPKGEALQQAKLAFLEEFKNNDDLQAPFFWGSFVVLGNTEPVDSLIDIGLWAYWKVFAGILGVLLCFLTFKLRNRFKKTES